MSLAGLAPFPPSLRLRSRPAAVQSAVLSPVVLFPSSPPPPPMHFASLLVSWPSRPPIAPSLALWLECLKWPRAETLISTATRSARRRRRCEQEGDRPSDGSLAGRMAVAVATDSAD